jgi:glycogen debranching enzyme
MQTNRVHLLQRRKAALLSLCVLIACSTRLEAQPQATSDRALAERSWSTDGSTGPARFISVHGRRAAIFGYSETGLEFWAYPVQIVSSFTVSFRHQGETTWIDGQTILRRIVYSPEAVTRIYAGSDFIIRERLFVPLDEPGAIITYETESTRPVDIEARFSPVLDLMWPASLGGQETLWSSAASAYLLSEPTHRFAASIGSPDIVAHDETRNNTRHVGRAPGLAFTVRAGGGHEKTARVVITGRGPEEDASAIATKLLEDEPSLEKAAVDHYSDLLSHALQIETPDARANRALTWSEIALDQAWVCNPDLGCGQVAGYGPSRKARRPQYDWFFAGDGMVAVAALIAAGQYDRARQELEFILKYQDQKTGMIWHELSQSAALLDWGKYPYMFVHVDLTFDFLNTIGDYFSATGDQDFVKTHWLSIQSAYEYCRSLLDPKDGLPRIPSGKQGIREQDPLSDELALSAKWVAAAQAFARLAAVAGDAAAASEASTIAQRASQTIGQRYWDERQKFWIIGYTRSGTPVVGRDIGPANIIGRPLFSQAQSNSIIDQLAASDFQTDWGTRGRSSSASTYDPNSYASGSVWAVGTSSVASAFWAEHRPATALPIWSALLPWSSLDSLGHMHEALAGDYYHEEEESVPEQTWSSAAFFTATVNGLLGLHVSGGLNQITFAPHLPPSWDTITLRNVHVGASDITMRMAESGSEVSLQMRNEGAPVQMVFNPEIPFGAKLKRAQLGSQSIAPTLEENEEDTHARVKFDLPHGSTQLTIRYAGGIMILSCPPQLEIGEASKAIKITGVNLKNRLYTVDFDRRPSAISSFEVRTPWTIQDAQGATLQAIAPGIYRLTIKADSEEKQSHAYRHNKVTLILGSDKK